MASVDHGPHAPSIAIARMAVTCGLPLNGAMASAINALDDVHGGAGQQCMELLRRRSPRDRQAESDAAERRRRGARRASSPTHGKIIPGFGHRFHPRRSARGAPARAGRRGRGGGRRHRPLCRHRQRGRSGMLAAHKGKPHPDEHRRRHRGDLSANWALRRRWDAACSSCRARSAFSRMPGNRSSRAAASRGRCRQIHSLYLLRRPAPSANPTITTERQAVTP